MEAKTEEQLQTESEASRGVQIFVRTLAFILVALAIAWALDLYRYTGVLPYSEQFLGTMLGISMVMVFLWIPAGRGTRQGPVPWYDWIASITGGVTCAYLVARYPTLADLYSMQPLDAVIVGTILIILTAEGLRRTVGPVLFYVFGFFVAFGLLGQFVPAPLTGHPIQLPEMATYLTFDTNSLMGTPLRVVTSIVVAFLLMGSLLLHSGGTAFFTDLSIAVMGRYRGGSAKIAVTASGLFGSISGSVVSNVVSTGVITIPLMRDGGYRPHAAAAIEAVASTGGQLMPPVMGAAAFLMAEFLEVPYSEVVLAALVPSILYYAGLFFQADLEAVKFGIVRVDPSIIPRLGLVLMQGWIFSVPFIVLIYTLFWLNWPPEVSALAASGVLLIEGLVIGYKGKRMKAADFGKAISATGINVLDIMMIAAAAGMIIGILNQSGLGFALTILLVKVGGENLFLLLSLAAVVCIVLGMGMPTVGVYILLATLVAPAMVKVGIDPMAAHLYVLYFGMMSMITPPIAIGAFAAATVAKTDPIKTAFSAMRFGWSAFVIPFMFIFSPSLLLNAGPLDIALTITTAITGIWLVSIGVIGFFRRAVPVLARLLFVVAGLALMIPADAFAGALWTDLGGGLLGALLFARELTVRNLKTVSAAES